MQHTHRINYLGAYDTHGRLLWPCDYRKYLQGALVQHFTLVHRWKKRLPEPCDTYAVYVFLMCILVPPPTSGPVTPEKRKSL